jgi:hypothetical protein
MTREQCTNDDRDPAAADQMTALERRARRLLLVYPPDYRRDRGEEIIGTLLEATPEGTSWPRVRDARALALGGLKARAAQNRQRTASANLRVAIMAGLAMYLAYWVTGYVYSIQWVSPHSALLDGSNNWTAIMAAVLTSATIVLAWVAPRAVTVLVCALAASAAVVLFALEIGGPAAVLGPRLLQVVALAGLAVLAPRTGHSSRHWLWLPGVMVVSTIPFALDVGYGWFLTSALPLLVIAVAGLLWVAVDARLIVAVLTFLAVTASQLPVADIQSGIGVLATLPFLGVVLALAAPAAWLLRRQSARRVS